ncbi:MAG: class I SAM-dependent methyltransferase [Chitinophagales bacterium]
MAANFNRIAPFYDPLSQLVYGNNLKDAKRSFLNKIPLRGRVLLMGGGTGNILNELFEKNHEMMIDFIEPSSGMIKIAEHRLNKKFRSRVNFICGDHHSIPAGKQYDVATSFFVMDCFKNEEALEFSKILASSLKVNGFLLFADFFYTEKRLQRLLIKFMYEFFNIISNISAKKLPDYDHIFRQLGFLKIEEKIFMKGLIRSRVYCR